MGLIVGRLGLAVVAAAVMVNASAGTLYEDYSAGLRRSQNVQSLGSGAFGDTVDPYTGRVEFYVEDLSIPGNAGLDISVGRAIEAYDTGFRPSYVTFASISLSIPRLEGVFASGGWVAQSDTDYTKPNVNRCSALTKNPPEVDGSRANTSFESNEYWHGNHLVIPGKTKQLMLEAGALIPSNYQWSTNQNWVFSCLPQTSNGVPGEGFLAFSPDGVKYYFDRVVSHGSVTDVRKPDTFGTSTTQLSRAEWYIYPSKVEDRFGNTLTYTYIDDRISEIASNDGRRITFAYLTDGSLTSISDGTRTWQYSDGLRHVIYPDGSAWNMAVSGAFSKTPSAFQYYSCSTPPSPLITGQATITIDLPSGARGVFAFAPNRRGISYVGSQCNFGSEPGQGIVKVIDEIVLTAKTITGPALTPATWTYIPGPANDSFSAHCASGCVSTRTTQITNPDGSSARSTFSNRKGPTEGALLVNEVYSASGALMSTTTYDYEYAQFANSDVGYTLPMAGDPTQATRKALKSQVTTQDGTNFSFSVSNFDGFARPLSVTSSNSLGYTRTDTTTYYDDQSLWVVGQIRSITNVDTNSVVSQTDYGWKALPWKTYSFGKLQQTLSYDSTSTVASGQLGTLKTVSDGRDGTLDTTITLSNWKRGIPQSIKYPVTVESPTGAIQSAAVNDDGTTASVTDENGYKTCYAYDEMGRLAGVTYPSETQVGVCDATAWNSRTYDFSPVDAEEYGIPAGHWRRIEYSGNYRMLTYFDALWRPVLTLEQDQSNAVPTRRYVARTYDLNGREAFVSYPTASVSTWAGVTQGTRTTYDALNRVSKVEQDSELGVLTTTTSYLNNASGPYTLVTNPRTQQTRTWYQMFDQPDYSKPVTVWHPEGAYTHITRDVFGKPTRLRRSDSSSPIGGTIAQNRDYTYNSYQELCRTDETETGASFMGHDAAGNLAWSALGYVSSPGCVTATDVAARRVDRTYDARNRVKTMSFPNGLGNTSYDYWPDGALKTLTTDNGSGNVVISTYDYNRLRLLTRERLQQPSVDWPIDYFYNGNGHLASEARHGFTVDYAPNALGQPTKAGTFATGVSYHPNGAIKQFTYGNGIVHTLTQNARGLPDTSQDAYSTTAFLSDAYDYDANGNVAGITDGATGRGQRGNRTMTYDGLDRLKTAVSPMFSASPNSTASYTYDVLDNLTRVIAPGRDHYYCYDTGRWQLTNVKTGSCGGTSVIGLGYDVQGNLENKNGVTFAFDYGNRLRAAAGEVYSYDGHGRRVRASRSGVGDILSQYSSDGALRRQRDERAGKDTDYITLGGSFVARVNTNLLPGVPSITVLSYSSNGSYTVQWNAIANAATYELHEQVNSGVWTQIQNTSATSRAVSGQASGTYGYRVRACAAWGCGPWSSAASVAVELPPATPPTLIVPATGANGSYTVSWTGVPGATSYTLEESPNGGAWVTAYSNSGTSKAFLGKPAGSYAYRATACNPSGCSGYSVTGTVQVIYAPTLTVPATNTTGSYTVSWTAVSGATSYQLDESANGGSTWAQIQSSTATSRAISGKSTGSYSYRVKACMAAGCGPVSTTASVQVTLPPTTAPTVTAPATNSTGSYTVSWTTVAGATSYQLDETSNSGSTWTQIQNGSATSKVVSGKSTGAYGYRVTACNAAGCGPMSGTASVQVTLPPTSAPILTVPASNSTGSYVVSWTGVTGATSYQLDESTNGGSTWAQIQASSANSWTASGKTTGTYSYRVRACNAGGCGPYSATSSTNVSTVPIAPTLSVPFNSTTGSFTVNWTLVANATSYQLEESSNYGAWVLIYNGAGTYLSRTRANGDYSYRVKACNANGCGAYSATRTITVEKERCPTCLVQSQPQSLSAKAAQGGE